MKQFDTVAFNAAIAHKLISYAGRIPVSMVGYGRRSPLNQSMLEKDYVAQWVSHRLASVELQRELESRLVMTLAPDFLNDLLNASE